MQILHVQFLIEHVSVRLNVVTSWFLGPGISSSGGASTSQELTSNTLALRLHYPWTVQRWVNDGSHLFTQVYALKKTSKNFFQFKSVRI